MFGAKKDEAKKHKQPGPKEIPGKIAKFIVSELKEDASWLTFLRSVSRNAENEMQEMRIYDPGDADAAKVPVANYESLDGHPELVIYELTSDIKMDRIQIRERKTVAHNITILSQDEILKKIEALGDAETSVMFYTAAGPNAGGPLGRGCAIVELNPDYPGKSNKKYFVYTDDVINMQPAGRKIKLWDSNKEKEVASWLKQAHRERFI